MTDDQLQADVAAELLWDPKVDSEAIVVSGDAGTVTLRGTVGSFREKREAGQAACRVYGVARVDNELNVRLLDGSKARRRRAARRQALARRGDGARAAKALYFSAGGSNSRTILRSAPDQPSSKSHQNATQPEGANDGCHGS
jgi:BON domain